MKPERSPAAKAAPPSLEGVGKAPAADPVREQLESVLRSILATGGSFPEAERMMKDLWLEHPEHKAFVQRKAMDWLREQGRVSSDFSPQLVRLLVEDPSFWEPVLEEMEDLEVAGDLDFSELSEGIPGGLRSLPRNLVVHGSLTCGWTSDFSSIPPGMVVDGDLDLADAIDWDGIIPKGTKIGGRIYGEVETTHPGFDNRKEKGKTLRGWRRKYGYGSSRRGQE